MKIGVFSDIHSNIRAFKECLAMALANQVDEFIFLGDYLGDLANPIQTMCLLYEIKSKYRCTFIRGNKEDYWINHRKDNEFWELGSTTTGMLKYVYSFLQETDLVFFESMPISKIMHYPNLPAFTICHGSPLSASESMRPDKPYLDDLLRKANTNLVLCGHFHMQICYERQNARVVNPGAIGVPLHSNGLSQFMILSSENNRWSYNFFSVPYDVNETISDMNKEHLFEIAPGWYEITKHLLLTGQISHAEAVEKIKNQFFIETGNDNVFDIPNTFWVERLKCLFNKEYT